MAAGSRSRGSVLLARVEAAQARKADAIGVNRVTIARWETGATTPPDEFRGRLQELWGIPPSAWDEGPTASTGARPAAIVHEDELGAASMSVEGRVEEIERALDRLMRDLNADQDMSKRDRGTVLESATRMVTYLAKLKGTYELGARLFKLPVYVRWKALVVEALKPWPDAMRAVADALAKAGDE